MYKIPLNEMLIIYCILQLTATIKLGTIADITCHIAENIGEFSCLDYLEEEMLANGLPIKYRY